MQKNKSQTGSAHAVIIIVVIVALAGMLGFIFWNNFLKEKPKNDTNSQTSQTEAEKPADPYSGWKTYETIAPSGLSFKYPSDWEFTPPTKEFVNNSGGKMNDLTLYSKKPQSETRNGAPLTTSQFMCVNFTEYTGDWQYSKQTYSNELSSESFLVAGTSLLLNTYSDSDRESKPMGSIMRLMSNPTSDQGQSYISTRNGYYVQATSQYNCIQGGEGIENMDADFTAQPDTITAKLILKSIQF